MAVYGHKRGAWGTRVVLGGTTGVLGGRRGLLDGFGAHHLASIWNSGVVRNAFRLAGVMLR